MNNVEIIPIIGNTYRLAKSDDLGDYSNCIIIVEQGPRQPNNQYRVSWGTGNYDVDWIYLNMFKNAKLITR